MVPLNFQLDIALLHTTLEINNFLTLDFIFKTRQQVGFTQKKQNYQTIEAKAKIVPKKAIRGSTESCFHFE